MTVDSLGTLVDPNDRLVGQTYRALLGRLADAAGLEYWTSLMEQGLGRVQVAMDIQRSLEFQVIAVQQAYARFLGRPADPLGLAAHVQLLTQGGAIEQVQALLIGSTEYFQNRGGGTNDGFLAALYQDVFGRAVDPSGQAAYGAALAQGVDRALIASALFDSREYRHIQVQGYYQDFLHRAADPDGLNAGIAFLSQGGRAEALVANIVGSAEFFAQASPGASQRFVTQLFRDLLERDVDPAGLGYFVGLLDQGLATPAQVALAIESSTEYRSLVVQRLYEQFLDRAADARGLNGHVQFLMQGGSVDQLKAIFAGSAEYFQNRGRGSNDGFLQALYVDVLGRSIDPAGHAAWSQLLALGVSRESVALAVVQSPRRHRCWCRASTTIS